MNSTPAVRARDLVKTFRGPHGDRVTAVDRLDLTIQPGEVVAVLGPNGAGKTTTIDMILGLTQPDSGSVEVYGRAPRIAARGGTVAAVLQSGGLLPDFTVEETVRIVAALHHRSSGVAAVMATADITHLAGRKVSRCSGGEQQRLKFALATLPDPELIVLDEPTAGMDVESRRTFWNAMRTDAVGGRTVLFATHYLAEADDFADRVVMIAGGSIVADGSTDEIRAMTGRRMVSGIIGESELAAVAAAFGDLEVTDRRGGRTYLSVADSDAVARYLLSSTRAREIEIVTHDLEDAFVALTSAGGADVDRPSAHSERIQ